jgi:hypothetical protein
MSNDNSITAPERQRILFEEDYEIRDWCKSLGCTPSELYRAVAQVGNSADKVRQYLKS